MPNIEVRGKYRTFRYDGDAPLDFTPYNNSIFLIRRPNPTTFVTLQQYVPGQGGVFTTFLPGSSYTIVTNADGSQDFNFDMGPYTRVDRLPSSTTIKSPNFYIGLDKNSIAVPISSYALSQNSPLISVVNILYINGQGNRLQYLAADSFKTGAPVNFTHFLPNSGYELRNSAPYTFFAPLQSEMGDAFALGNNDGGEYGMGYRYSQTRYFNDVNGTPFVLSADQTFGIWDKIVCSGSDQTVSWNGQTFTSASLAALSSHGASKALFVLGSNFSGQLGTGSTQQYYPTWTRVSGQWADIDMGSQHMVATNTQGHLYACGSNTSGQLGLGSGVAKVNTLTLVDNTRNYVQLAATSSTSHARDTNGAVYGCGNNLSGQLGINNTNGRVYALTREATNSTWTSIKTIKGYQSILIALKDNALYGCGSNGLFFGGGPAVIYRILTREVLNLNDITDFYTTGFGTFIRRQGQDYLFAAGSNTDLGDSNLLATVSGGTTNYFTKTTIPSQMRNIISNYSYERPPEGSAVTRYNIGYIGADFNVYTKQLNTNVFVQKEFKAFDAFSQPINATGYGKNTESPIFLLSAASHFRPSPTPSPTPTLTPTPTVTPPPGRPSNFDVMLVGGGGGAGASFLFVQLNLSTYTQVYCPAGGGSGGGILLALNKPFTYFYSQYVGPGNNPDDPNNPYINVYPNPPVGSQGRPLRIDVGYGGVGGIFRNYDPRPVIEYRAPTAGQNSRIYFINNGFQPGAPNEIDLFIGRGGNVGASYGGYQANAAGPARNAYGSGGGGSNFGLYQPGGIGSTPTYNGFVYSPNIVNNGGDGYNIDGNSGGGGGGAGASGQAGRSNGGGNGGNGYYTDFSGTYSYYAGGGGGGTGGRLTGPNPSKSSGGLGGGGGAANNVGTNGVFPGGGGGAGDPVWSTGRMGDFYGTGGDGGRGVVIIRYPINSGKKIVGGAGNATYVEKDGYRIYVFSSNTSIYW
jgi:hypothetical protein